MQALQVVHLNIWQEDGKIVAVAQPVSKQETGVVKGYKSIVLVGDRQMCPWNLPPMTYQVLHSKHESDMTQDNNRVYSCYLISASASV